MEMEMTVQELKELLDSGADDFVLLDVPHEYDIARFQVQCWCHYRILKVGKEWIKLRNWLMVIGYCSL